MKFAGFLALWFLFSFTLSRNELYVGAACASLSIIALEISLRAEPLCFRPRVRWLKLLLSLPGSVVHDLILMLAVVFDKLRGRRIHSQFQVTRFTSEQDTPRECARRALAVGFATVPPNSVVIGINREKKTLLYHELVHAPELAVVRALREDK